jgi:hypothetical protein
MDLPPILKKTVDPLYYVLYDLRKEPSLSNIHLPSAHEDGPVLLRVNEEDYRDLYSELQEMNENEGHMWMTSKIHRPLYAPTNTSDLIVDASYVLVAHMALVKDDPEAFIGSLSGMRELLTH